MVCNSDLFQESLTIAVGENRWQRSYDSGTLEPHLPSDRGDATDWGRRPVLNFCNERWRFSNSTATSAPSCPRSMAISTAYDDQVIVLRVSNNWSRISTFFIFRRVPEHLANLSNSDDDSTDMGAVKSSIATSSSLKRPAPSDFNDSGIEAKVEKLGEWDAVNGRNFSNWFEIFRWNRITRTGRGFVWRWKYADKGEIPIFSLSFFSSWFPFFA